VAVLLLLESDGERHSSCSITVRESSSSLQGRSDQDSSPWSTRHKVFHNASRVGTCIDFARLGAGRRTEARSTTGCRSTSAPRRADRVPSNHHVLGFRDSLPNRAHVEEVHERVIG